MGILSYMIACKDWMIVVFLKHWVTLATLVWLATYCAISNSNWVTLPQSSTFPSHDPIAIRILA
jgi:hypothetical protein